MCICSASINCIACLPYDQMVDVQIWKRSILSKNIKLFSLNTFLTQKVSESRNQKHLAETLVFQIYVVF